MGTDIEMFAERRTPTGWDLVSDPVKDPDDRSLVPAEIADFGRPYELFSVLAAHHIDSFGRLAQVPFISKPRGFPNDLHDFHDRYVKQSFHFEPLSGDWGASWLMVREILDFDWDGQSVERYAYIEREFAHLFDPRKPFPKEISKDRLLYHDLFLDPPEGTVKVRWSTPLRDYVGCAEWFIEHLLPLGPPDQVRVVYWFNS